MFNSSTKSTAVRIATAGIAVTAFSLAGCSGGSGEASGSEGGPEPVTIRTITPLSADWAEMDGFNEEFIPAVEELAPWVTVEVVGGSEVVPSNAQVEAVSTGAYDMAPIYPGYAEGFIPGISAALINLDLPSEERAAGTGDLYNEIFFNPNGMTYLGAQHGGDQYAIYLGEDACESFDPENPSLDGMVIRGGDQYAQAVDYLGGSVVNMPVGEVYNAVERGVIDGYGMTGLGMPAIGTGEITGCRIEPSFKTNTSLLAVNTAWWEGLEAETREVIEEAVVLAEGRMEESYAPKIEESEDWHAENGIESIELSPEEGEKLIEEVDARSWEEAIEANPEVKKLRDLWEG